MDSINEIIAKTEVPLEPSPEVKAKVAAKKENKRKLAEVYIFFQITFVNLCTQDIVKDSNADLIVEKLKIQNQPIIINGPG